ncbi:hypothetical protein P3S68_009005 [Capsicum galapagoense]
MTSLGLGSDFLVLSAYLFLYVPDYVFDPACSTRNVYEQGARDVALSALNGINSRTIVPYSFAYRLK